MDTVPAVQGDKVYYVKNPVDFGAGLLTIKRAWEPNYRREICHSVRGVLQYAIEKNRKNYDGVNIFTPQKQHRGVPGESHFSAPLGV